MIILVQRRRQYLKKTNGAWKTGQPLRVCHESMLSIAQFDHLHTSGYGCEAGGGDEACTAACTGGVLPRDGARFLQNVTKPFVF